MKVVSSPSAFTGALYRVVGKCTHAHARTNTHTHRKWSAVHQQVVASWCITMLFRQTVEKLVISMTPFIDPDKEA